jgi:MFS family permease
VDSHVDERRLYAIDEAVFVDRYGRRRRVVIGAGLVLAAALLGWLALMGVGVIAAVVAPTVPAAAGDAQAPV